MNPTQLLGHFDRISEAPDAIPRLRLFVLDLAVRGKLVPQDLNDESAPELLKRIQREKTKLLQEGKIRKPRELEVDENDPDPFPIPPIWAWCRLSDVGAIVGGGTPTSSEAANFTAGGSGIAWLTPADLGKHSTLSVSHGERDLTPQGLRSSSATLMPKGSVLFTSRAPIGYTAIAVNEVSTNQGFKSVVPYILECNHYIAIYFRAFAKRIDEKASGTTFREVSGKVVAKLPFPLPPLAEQHRIVAKVDELMAVCDRLEAGQAERERRRDRLLAASLNRLNNGADTQSFRDHARFHLDHLPRLATRPVHIQQLRQTILNLVVRGKLVPQDPNDEPASELLKRIQMERKQLAHEKVCKESTMLPPVANHEKVFLLPPQWEWDRLGSLVFALGDGLHGTPAYAIGTPYYFINGNNLIKGKIVIKPSTKTVAFDEFQKHKKPLSLNTVLVSINGTLGNVAFYENELVVLGKSACYLNLPECIDKRFIKLLIDSPYFTGYALENATGTTIKNLSLKAMREFPVLLPPLAEQHRIVAKVDELMALCDQLESQLTTTQTESRCLLESVLRAILEWPFKGELVRTNVGSVA
jgi:type I restriction enzyme, S subunit